MSVTAGTCIRPSVSGTVRLLASASSGRVCPPVYSWCTCPELEWEQEPRRQTCALVQREQRLHVVFFALDFVGSFQDAGFDHRLRPKRQENDIRTVAQAPPLSVLYIWLDDCFDIIWRHTVDDEGTDASVNKRTSSWSLVTGFSPGLSPGLAPRGCRTRDSSPSPRRRRGPGASAPTCPCRTAASSHRAPTAGSRDGSAGGGCSGCCRA